MNRPDKENELFWFPIEKIDGGTQQKFNHVLYENHLEIYCNELEQKLVRFLDIPAVSKHSTNYNASIDTDEQSCRVCSNCGERI